MAKCEQGCTCKRHTRKISHEHYKNIVAANQARKGESHKCPEGCTCNRHQAYYRGGSKKGRKLSDQARENLSSAAKERAARPEERQRFAEMAAATRANPELESRRISALREALTGTSCPEGCQCGKHSEEARQKMSESHLGTTLSEEHKRKIGDASRATWAARTPEETADIMAKRSKKLKEGWAREKASGKVRQTGGYLHSRHELSLIPYMKALGYTHNTDGKFWIGRKVPDFIDHENKRVYEYFGTYWHPRKEEEDEAIDYYSLHGWECTILWEQDLFTFLTSHQELVTEEEHAAAWQAAHVNNGYRKPE